LRTDAEALAKSLERVANRFPELAEVARKYSEVLDVDVAEVDVTAVWSVGGSLASFAQAYREQNVDRTLLEPLEPPTDALLQALVREHGAYVMGFEQGRDLVQRADQFAVGPVRLAEIQDRGAPVLNELTNNSNLVEEGTRELHRTVYDSVSEFGWSGSRMGFSAYLIIRNCLRAIIKFSIGNDRNLAASLGLLTGGSLVFGDPNAEFIRAALPILQN
jgi:hypothetical protein